MRDDQSKLWHSNKTRVYKITVIIIRTFTYVQSFKELQIQIGVLTAFA